MAYCECLSTRLNPLAERTCFSQVGPVVGSALSARDMRLPYAILPPLGHTRLDSRPKQLRPCTKKRTAVDSAIRADIGDLPFLGVLMSIVSLCYLVSHVRPCGGLYCHPFSNEGLDGISETPTHSTIFSVAAYEPNPASHCDLLSTQYQVCNMPCQIIYLKTSLYLMTMGCKMILFGEAKRLRSFLHLQ